MLYYFIGDDTFAGRQAIEDIAQKKRALIRWVDRQELSEKSLQDWADQAAGGLFSVEVLVMRDPSLLPKAVQEAVVKAVGQPLPADCVFWDRVSSDKRSGLYRALKPYLKEFLPMPPSELVQWLIGEANKKKSVLDEPAARELVGRLGSNRWQLLSELEKLTLANKEVSLVEVQQQVPPLQSEPEIFAMLDAIAAGRLPAALTAMELILQGGASELYVLSMLAYQFKTLLAIKNGLSRGLNNEQVAQEAKLHPYVVKKNSMAAARYTSSMLLGYLTRIMATDFAIKQGKVDPRTGLIMLMTSLVQPATKIPAHR